MSRVVSVSLSNFTPLEVAFCTEKDDGSGKAGLLPLHSNCPVAQSKVPESHFLPELIQPT